MTSNVAEGGGFIATSPDLDAPDIQITMGAVMFVDEALTAPYDHAFGASAALRALPEPTRPSEEMDLSELMAGYR